MIIDTHVHLWQRNRNPQPWIDPRSMAVIDRDFWVNDLEAQLDSSGIDGAVVVQAANSIAETVDLLAVSSSERIIGVVGWVNCAGDVPRQIDLLRRTQGGGKLVGIRHLAHTDPDPAWLARRDVGAGLDALGAAHLPFDLVVAATQLPLVTEVVSAHPNVQFVLDHLAKPQLRTGDIAQWRADLAALAERPNVRAKLSGLAIEADWTGWTPDDLAPAIDHALEAFGPSRLMFGSDWPLVDLTGGITRWLDVARSRIAPADADAVFGANALATYRKIES